jgi:hypothetical protein
MEAALVRLHRLAYERLPQPKTISRECICTYIDEHGGGWSHLHGPDGITSVSVPTVISGLPVEDIVAAMIPVVGPELIAALEEGRIPEVDDDQVQESLNKIDTTPDDSLPWK